MPFCFINNIYFSSQSFFFNFRYFQLYPPYDPLFWPTVHAQWVGIGGLRWKKSLFVFSSQMVVIDVLVPGKHVRLSFWSQKKRLLRVWKSEIFNFTRGIMYMPIIFNAIWRLEVRTYFLGEISLIHTNKTFPSVVACGDFWFFFF